MTSSNHLRRAASRADGLYKNTTWLTDRFHAPGIAGYGVVFVTELNRTAALRFPFWNVRRWRVLADFITRTAGGWLSAP
jgi:hypothetical protein